MPALASLQLLSAVLYGKIHRKLSISRVTCLHLGESQT